VTAERSPSALGELPRSATAANGSSGRSTANPRYHDRRDHRLDVLLENADGDRYLSEYYRLRPTETAGEFVRRAERDGCDCDMLARWIPTRDTYRRRSAIPRRPRRVVHGLYVRLVR
jgi:hypothetical protein